MLSVSTMVKRFLLLAAFALPAVSVTTTATAARNIFTSSSHKKNKQSDDNHINTNDSQSKTHSWRRFYEPLDLDLSTVLLVTRAAIAGLAKATKANHTPVQQRHSHGRHLQETTDADSDLSDLSVTTLSLGPS